MKNKDTTTNLEALTACTSKLKSTLDELKGVCDKAIGDLLNHSEVPETFKEGLALVQKEARKGFKSGDVSATKVAMDRLRKTITNYQDGNNS